LFFFLNAFCMNTSVIAELMPVGIDISKSWVDVAISPTKVKRFGNTIEGFDDLRRFLPDMAQCVMEATGNYHVALAEYLVSHQIRVAVVNPLRVKRFGESEKSCRAKTDRADAKLLYLFAKSKGETLRPYQSSSEAENELRQLQGVREMLIKQQTAAKNHLESLMVLPRPSKKAVSAAQAQLDTIAKSIKELEKSIDAAAEDLAGDAYEHIESIPGIGKTTLAALIAATGGFTRFDSASEFIAFIGTAPGILSSGSSVRGSGAIGKNGDPRLRALLYMCAVSASQWNEACKTFYQRLRAANKPVKVAMIAVLNKLIRQVFALAKSKRAFDQSYHHKTAVAAA